MLAAAGVNVNLVFAITFVLGAGLAGLGGVIGAVELSMVPGEDTRLLLASLIVVIVGGMGSVVGAAIGAVILGLAETYGLAYAPTYSVVFTFVILILVLAFRPRGIMGKGIVSAAQLAARDERRRAARDCRAARPAAAVPVRRHPGTDAVDRGAALARCAARARSAPRHIVVVAALLLLPFVATPFFTFQVARAVAGARPDRAVADLPRRLRRHGVAGADDGGRHRRLRARDPRHQQQRRDQPRLAVVGSRCRSRCSSRPSAPR